MNMLGALAVWTAIIWLLFTIRRASKKFLETQARQATIGTKWEQIAPMDECFDDEEDDL